MHISSQPIEANAEVDVIVVGAGLSGLCAARRIAEKGYSLLVLEARNRLGGHTLSIPFRGGIVDLGAQWVDPQHQHVLHLAQELGVERVVHYQQGKKLREINDKITAYRWTNPKLSFAGQIDLQWTLARIGRLCKQVPLQAPHQSHRAEEWSQMSVAEFRNEQMWSRDGRATFDLMVRIIFAAEPADISMLHFLWSLHGSDGFAKLATMKRGLGQERFAGGAQQLAIRLAAIVQKHGQPILLNTAVHAIHQDDKRISVKSSDGTFFAKYAIVSIPPSAAKRIDFQPASPQANGQLHSQLAVSAAIKVISVYETPFWRQQGFSGEVISNSNPLHLVFDSSDQYGNFGALSGFLFGDSARQWAKRRSEELQAMVTGELVRYFGMAAATQIAFFHQDWGAESANYDGSTAFAPPGVFLFSADRLCQPWKCIHWAGAETSAHSFNFLNGAVEAGERAANEVLQRLLMSR